MNRKGFSQKDFLNVIIIIVTIIILYIAFKAIKAKLGS